MIIFLAYGGPLDRFNWPTIQSANTLENPNKIGRHFPKYFNCTYIVDIQDYIIGN